MTGEDINSIIETQLELWPEAKKNFDALIGVERRELPLGDFPAYVQFNPARIRSTGAKVDAASIRQRPCFLCASNRPEQQLTIPFSEDFDLLVNPYPILPVHFTLTSRNHVPQDSFTADMLRLAVESPDLVVFFNGAKAGASAPDHLHGQAVLKSEVPILRVAERFHPSSEPEIQSSAEWNADLPFRFFSAVIPPQSDGRDVALMARLSGREPQSDNELDPGLVNIFCWVDNNGLLRMISIPRQRHRPLCYGDGPGQMLISPGALDMGGIVITPRLEDFKSLTPDILRSIYADTAFPDGYSLSL
ncbi:MAG: DUF4922 domain-containing protein [Bacteroidales bacterium]|nr:DUF4922 domain-containing protein [Bacteroidales bacterium]MDE7465120.1 DUF4922 domain-containing protein [Muribaculaceae bacterium]